MGAELDGALQRRQGRRPPDDKSSQDHHERQRETYGSADELRNVGVIDKAKAMPLLDCAEKAAPQWLLAKNVAGAGIHVDVLPVRKADDRRAVTTLQDLDPDHRRAGMEVAGL